MSRPSSYTQEVADLIVDRLTEEPMVKICAEEGMPDRKTVNRWMLANPDFAARCARAREIRAQEYVEETVAIADEPPERGPTGAVDNGDVQDKKVRISARQWYAEKIDPKRFGQKVAIGGADDLPPVRKVSDEELDAMIAAKMKELNGQGG